MSPRRISAWFRGRNRQSTLMLHSLLVSAMVVDDEGLGASPTASVACAREEGNAGLGSRRRTGDLSLGPREQLGRPGEDALSVSCGTGCGRPGRLVLSALCLSAPRAAAALRAWAGRAGAAGAGFPSQGVILRTATTRGWSFPSAHLVPRSGGSRITLSSPLPHTAHFATRDPSVPPQTPPTGKDKGSKVGQSPAWERSPTGPPVPCIPEHPLPNHCVLFSYLNHTDPPSPSLFPFLRCTKSQSAFMGVHLQK